LRVGNSYMHTYMHTHTHAHTHAHICTHTHMHTYAHTHTYAHIRTHTHTHVQTHADPHSHISVAVLFRDVLAYNSRCHKVPVAVIQYKQPENKVISNFEDIWKKLKD